MKLIKQRDKRNKGSIIIKSCNKKSGLRILLSGIKFICDVIGSILKNFRRGRIKKEAGDILIPNIRCI